AGPSSGRGSKPGSWPRVHVAATKTKPTAASIPLFTIESPSMENSVQSAHFASQCSMAAAGEHGAGCAINLGSVFWGQLAKSDRKEWGQDSWFSRVLGVLSPFFPIALKEILVGAGQRGLQAEEIQLAVRPEHQFDWVGRGPTFEQIGEKGQAGAA